MADRMKRIFSYYFIVICCLLFVTQDVCLANMITFPDGSVQYATTGFEELNTTVHYLEVIIFDTVTDLVILAVCFAVLKEFKRLVSYKFFLYLPMVVIGGFIIDEVVDKIHFQVGIEFLIIAILLAFNNAFLPWAFYRLKLVKAVCIGLAMGILTNPVLWKSLLEPILTNPVLSIACGIRPGCI